MKKLLFIILVLIPTICYAQNLNPIVEITEEDMSPSTYPYQVKFPNGTLTDNADGTVSYSGGGGAVSFDSICLRDSLSAVNNLYLGGDIYLNGQDIIYNDTKMSFGDNGVCIACDISNTGNIYTGESIYAGGNITTDSITIMNANIEQAMWVDSSGNVWAGLLDGLYKSTDNGATLTLKDNVASSGALPRMVFEASNGYLYWCPWAYGKIRRSTDGGDTWGDVGSFTATGAGIWGFCEDSNGDLYAGIYTSAGAPSQDVILRSQDDGATWASCYDGAEDHIHGVACDPYTDYIYATIDASGLGGTHRIIRSVDGGDNWTSINTGNNCIAINFFNGMRLFGADDNYGTIYTTTDDSTFTTAYQSGTIIVSFGTTKIGDRVYFGQITSGGGATNPQIISTTDGINFRVEWVGESTDDWGGPGWLSNYNNYLYASVDKSTTPDDSFIMSTDVTSTISRIVSDLGEAELLIRGDNVVVQNGDLRVLSGNIITDGDIEVIDSVLNITAGTSVKLLEGTQFYAYDSTDADYINFFHNGTNGYITTGGTGGGDLYLNPDGNDVIVTDADIVLTNQAYKVKFNNDDNIWVGRASEAGAVLNYYNSNLEVSYNDSTLKVNNVTAMNWDTTSNYSPLPLRIGADADANAIDNSSNGSSSSTLYIGNSTINVTAPSDKRVKENIVDTQYNLDDLLKVNVVDFNYKQDYIDDNSALHSGMIAQEMLNIYPECVFKRSDDMLAINYEKLVPLLIQSIKDLEDRVRELESEKCYKLDYIDEYCN